MLKNGTVRLGIYNKKKSSVFDKLIKSFFCPNLFETQKWSNKCTKAHDMRDLNLNEKK